VSTFRTGDLRKRPIVREKAQRGRGSHSENRARKEINKRTRGIMPAKKNNRLRDEKKDTKGAIAGLMTETRYQNLI